MTSDVFLDSVRDENEDNRVFLEEKIIEKNVTIATTRADLDRRIVSVSILEAAVEDKEESGVAKVTIMEAATATSRTDLAFFIADVRSLEVQRR